MEENNVKIDKLQEADLKENNKSLWDSPLLWVLLMSFLTPLTNKDKPFDNTEDLIGKNIFNEIIKKEFKESEINKELIEEEVK